jgi:hypothetical protein
MSHAMKRFLTLSAVLYGIARVGSAAGQEAMRTVEFHPLGPLTSMTADEQTRLALSAAPAEITSRASVYVLTDKRYKQVRTGTNGFTCLVEREMLATIEPVCYDAEGSATTVPARLYREELRSQGLAEDVVKTRIDAAYKAGRLHAPRKAGIVYMMSAEQQSWDPFAKKINQAPPHFMLYAPYATQADVGGFAGPQMPIVIWPGQPDALIIIMAGGSNAMMHESPGT